MKKFLSGIILIFFSLNINAQETVPRKSKMEILSDKMHESDKKLSIEEEVELFKKTQVIANSDKPAAIFSQYNLGLMYYEGKGTTKDLELAFYYMEKAAEEGVIGAILNLGYMHYNGEGTLKSYKEAYRWLSQGIMMKTHAKPLYYLALMNYYGNGTNVDKSKAALLMKQASEATFWQGYKEKIDEFWNDNELWKYE